MLNAVNTLISHMKYPKTPNHLKLMETELANFKICLSEARYINQLVYKQVYIFVINWLVWPWSWSSIYKLVIYSLVKVYVFEEIFVLWININSSHHIKQITSVVCKSAVWPKPSVFHQLCCYVTLRYIKRKIVSKAFCSKFLISSLSSKGCFAVCVFTPGVFHLCFYFCKIHRCRLS